MICPKCGYEYNADAHTSCPRCGWMDNIDQDAADKHRKLVQAKFTSGLFRCICIMMTVTAFLYLCSGRFGLFWILFSIAGWISCGSGQGSLKRLATGLQLYSVVLKVLQVVMFVLAGVFGVLSVAVLIVGMYTGDEWLSYLAGVSTEYGNGMIPAAVLGRLLNVILPLGGMLAVGVAAFVLAVIAAAVLLLAKLVQSARGYMKGMLCIVVDGKVQSCQVFRADISLAVMGTVQGIYSLTYINQSIIGLLASLCAAATLFLFAWLVRK